MQWPMLPPNLRRHMAAPWALGLLLVGAILLTPVVTRTAEPPHRLDISAFRETFSEDFRHPLNVTPEGPSRWIAHTPWGGDFGDAVFANPSPDFPFQTGPRGLTITARKDSAGKWASGLLSSVDAHENGFSQAKGYFEARMKMPPGPGTWPAFWLVSHKDPKYHGEIDVVEYYGHGTDWYQVNVHAWPKSTEQKQQGQIATITVPRNSLVQAFHTYGVEITDRETIFYLDRREVARQPATPGSTQPMSILVNLALGSGWPIDKTPNPSVLAVDYVKAFQRK